MLKYILLVILALFPVHGEISGQPWKAGKGSGYSMDELNRTGTGLSDEKSRGKGLTFYPNPAAKESCLTLLINDLHADVSLKFYSTQGQVSHEQEVTFTSGTVRVCLPEKARPGLYIVQIAGYRQVYTGKLMIISG